MDEEKKIEPNIIDVLKQKAAIENQLDSYINPTEKTKNDNTNAVSYYAGGEIKTEPMAKVPQPPLNSVTPIPQKQTRSIIRTYKSDVEESIQTSHISSINIALAENKKMFGQAKKTEIDVKKQGINKSIIIISLVLIFGGALVIIIPKILINMQYGAKQVPVETVSSQPLITADLEEKINIADINANMLATTLKERVDQSATSLGQVKNIYLTEGTGKDEKLLTASRFLQLIGANVPDAIQRTLKDQYMFGSYNFNGNQRFLILKVGEYDTTFSGMLAWETYLWQDFKELFELSDNSATSTSSLAIESAKFQDATFDNKDCRVVKDSNGNIIFLYSIIDQNTVVITTSTDTLKELINRLSKARVVTQ
jgi:hypothetical protein